jgi:hypothetical protein
MPAHAAAARFRRGGLAGGSAGEALCAGALDALHAAGAVRPIAIVEMLAPSPAIS